MGGMQISGSFVGASIARLWRLPIRLIFRDGCADGIYAAPTNQPGIFAPPFDRGRGDPTPPRYNKKVSACADTPYLNS